MPGPCWAAKTPFCLPRADAGETVCHADAHPFLPAKDRPDVELGAGVNQRIARITREKLGPFALEDFCDDVGALHLCSFD